MASGRVVDEATHTGDGQSPIGDEKAGGHGAVGPDLAVGQVIEDARMATEKERKMTLRQGIKLYPKAIAWSVLISTTIVMEGYDVALINNFCEWNTSHPIPDWFREAKLTRGFLDGFPQFNKKYGEQLPSGEYQVTAPWQSGISNVRNPLGPLRPS